MWGAAKAMYCIPTSGSKDAFASGTFRLCMPGNHGRDVDECRRRLKLLPPFNRDNLCELIDYELGIAAQLRLDPAAHPSAAISDFVEPLIAREEGRCKDIIAGKYKRGYLPDDPRPDLHKEMTAECEAARIQLEKLIAAAKPPYASAGIDTFKEKANTLRWAVNQLLAWPQLAPPQAPLPLALEPKVRDARDAVEGFAAYTAHRLEELFGPDRAAAHDMPPDALFRFKQWLTAKWHETTRPMNFVAKYTTTGKETPSPEECEQAIVPMEEVHAFLLAVGADFTATLDAATSAGWLQEACVNGPGVRDERFYWIMPAVTMPTAPDRTAATPAVDDNGPVKVDQILIDKISGGKQRLLLQAVNGKGSVAIDDVLNVVYGSKDSKNLEALLKTKTRLNRKLAENNAGCELRQKGKTLTLSRV
jgi:hypothetical protein